jgi:hypothetical protein
MRTGAACRFGQANSLQLNVFIAYGMLSSAVRKALSHFTEAETLRHEQKYPYRI